MKFDCGPTHEQRQRKKEQRQEERIAKLEEWHDYFCWWPKRLGPHDCRWLETIKRRGTYHSYSRLWDKYNRAPMMYFQPYFTWEYKSA